MFRKRNCKRKNYCFSSVGRKNWSAIEAIHCTNKNGANYPRQQRSETSIYRWRRRSMKKEHLKKMVDSCLSTPTPIRHLTPKQKAREAEREKLGLISKDRQRELDSLKEKAKKGKNAEEPPEIMGPPGLDLITFGVVDKEMIPKYELTVEDGRRLAKEYSRVLMRRHRARQTAESTLLGLKKEAIEALPEHLKATALVPDLTPSPANRFMATLTPPIEGYIDKIKEAAAKNVGKQKLR